MSYLSLSLSHWREVLVGVGILAAVGYCHERDRRIRAEAVANERLADLRVANARADSLDKVRARVDSQVAVARAHISELRREARRQASVADSLARIASIEVTQAGDSLRATLDSLYTVAPTELGPLVQTARRQHTRERAAQRTLVTALRDQLVATQDMLAASDSTARLMERRYTALEDAYEARSVECQQCREALEAMADAPSGPSWVERLLWAGAGAGIGALSVTLSR